MRKIKLLFVLLFISLLPILGSCSMNYEINAKVLDNNIIKENRADYITNMSNGFIANYDDIVDDRYEAKGIILVTRSNGNSAFYSMYVNSFITSFAYYTNPTYEVITDSNLGAIVKYRDGNEYKYVDCYGNVLDYKVENDYGTEIDTYVKNGELYLTMSSHYSNNRTTYKYSYINNRLVANKYEGDQYGSDGPNVNDNIFNINGIKLDSYGLKGYTVVNVGNTTYIYDAKNKLVTSFKLESRYMVAAGNNLYYQNKYALPSDEEKYDFIENQIKYKLVTTKIDLKNGKKKNIKLEYLFNNGSPFFDENKICNYNIVTLQKIEDKVLLPSETYIVNKNFDLIKDVSGINFSKLSKIGNNYFDVSTDMLYNEHLELLADLSRYNVVLDYVNNYFIISINGKKGLVDSNGNMLLACKYDVIDMGKSEFVLMEDNYLYRYELNNGIGTQKDSFYDYTRITNGLYCASDNYNYSFVGHKLNKNISSIMTLNHNVVNTFNNHYVFIYGKNINHDYISYTAYKLEINK